MSLETLAYEVLPIQVGFVSLKFSPDILRNKPDETGAADDSFKRDQKLWKPSNFTLTLQGLNPETSPAAQLDPIVISQAVVEAPKAGDQKYSYIPGQRKFSSLVFHLPQADADGLGHWCETCALKSAQIEFRGDDGAVLFAQSGLPDRSSRFRASPSTHLAALR